MSGSIRGLTNLVEEKYLELEVLSAHVFAHMLNVDLDKSIEYIK